MTPELPFWYKQISENAVCLFSTMCTIHEGTSRQCLCCFKARGRALCHLLFKWIIDLTEMIWFFGANQANQPVSQRCTHASKMCTLQKNTDARSSLRIVRGSFGASVQLTSSPLLLISSQTGACVHICTGCHYCLLPLARLACTAGATPI